LEEVTGKRTLDASVLLEYFAPLQDFLKSEEASVGYPRSWDSSRFEEYFGEGDISVPTPSPLPPSSSTTESPPDQTTTAIPTTTVVTPGSTSVEPEEEDKSNTGIIIGCVLGGLAIVTIIGIFAYVKLRKRNKGANFGGAE
jgi:hypothetical protein